jgi:hypothetical protein
MILSATGSFDVHLRYVGKSEGYIMLKYLTLLFSLLLVLNGTADAVVKEYDLVIDEQEVNITGTPVRAMTVNGSIPGPVLRFVEGDTAKIHVHNKLDVDTSIHWHGLLVPPDMDGVPYVSFPPIPAHSTFTYEFPVRQSGTYWYHSHTRLQEQKGLYGGIVIEPEEGAGGYDREYTVVLSDWTDIPSHEVLRTLRRGSHWFTIQKGTAQSLLGAARARRLWDYFKREMQRMPVMDIADVAYDRFLANGKSEEYLEAFPGERLRIRLIDGSSTTFFHMNFAGGTMAIIGADGQPLEPVRKKRFLIGVAETYDIELAVPGKGAYELRATSHDGSGYASIWIGAGKKHSAANIPFPDMYASMGKISAAKIFAFTPGGSMGMPDRDVEAGEFDRPGSMKSMGSMNSAGHKRSVPGPESGTDGKEHDTVTVGRQKRGGKGYSYNYMPLAADISSRGALVEDGTKQRPWPPYEDLRAKHDTSFSPEKEVREIRLTLDGDMERYVWFLNNRPLSESDMIHVRAGEITRFIMINRTMMHHPMHLHGQFFRVLNGQGKRAPLKHTVDVAPMSTTVIEFNGSETGDWFFHCHLLYHMESGMARIVHYEGFDPGDDVLRVRDRMNISKWYSWGKADALSNMTSGNLTASDIRNTFNARWEIGWQNVEDVEWETLMTYERYINRFLNIFTGALLEGEEARFKKEAAVFGAHYLLPLNIGFRGWIDTDGEWRFALEREIALTPRLIFHGEAEYDTKEFWEGKAGLVFRVSQYFSLRAQWHSEYGWGGGASILF